MELENLHIIKNAYGDFAGQYTGSCKFKSEYGTVEIQLDAQFSNALLQLVAESVVRASKDLAKNLTAETLLQVGGQLEDKSE